MTTLHPSLYSSHHTLFHRCVLGDWRNKAVDDLRRYFRPDGPPRTLFTGRHFDRFAGGGDAPNVRDRVTTEDVLALSFLSVRDRLGAFAVDVLEVHADEITALLRAIPVDVAMHQTPWATYAPGSAAFELWDLLRRCGGTNLWVYANKLLARKRPKLLPAYDHIVRNLIGAPQSYWECLWTWFDSDPRCAVALTEMRAEAGGIQDISLLRCLDVVLWMRLTQTRW
jgi:hypothetical protein